jgi:uncharacterized protein
MMSTIGSIQQPSFYSNWLQLLFDKVHAPYEVVVIGPEAIDVSHELMSHYSRNSFFMGGIVESSLPLLLYKYVEDETMIYVCQNKVCKFPVQEIDQAIRLMK